MIRSPGPSARTGGDPIRRVRSALLPMCVAAVATLSSRAAEPEPAAGPSPARGPLVTISRETTRLTGPLRPDGYVDYLEAMNDRLSRGVTPESNGAVLLWKAVGREWIDEGIRDRYFRALGIEAPPADTEAFLPLEEWIEGLEETTEPEEEEPEDPDVELPDVELLEEAAEEATRRPWTEREQPVIARWLERNRRSLDTVVAASRRERFYLPLVTTEDDAPVFAVERPSLVVVRQVSDALGARACLGAGSGGIGLARADALAMHRLARGLAGGSGLLDLMVGSMLETRGLRADLALAFPGAAGAEALRAHRRDIERLPPLPDLATVLDEGERYFFLDSVCALARDPSLAADAMAMGGGPSGEPTLLDGLRDALVQSMLDWDEILRLGNQWYDRIVAAHRQPAGPARSEALEAVNRELRAECARLERPLVRVAALLSREGRSRYVGTVLASLAVPATSTVDEGLRKTERRRKLVLLALEIAARRAESGAYPAALPPGIEAAPRYVRFPGGFVLVDPGRDGEPDGVWSEEAEEHEDDLIVRVGRIPDDGDEASEVERIEIEIEEE